MHYALWTINDIDENACDLHNSDFLNYCILSYTSFLNITKQQLLYMARIFHHHSFLYLQFTDQFTDQVEASYKQLHFSPTFFSQGEELNLNSGSFFFQMDTKFSSKPLKNKWCSSDWQFSDERCNHMYYFFASSCIIMVNWIFLSLLIFIIMPSFLKPFGVFTFRAKNITQYFDKKYCEHTFPLHCPLQQRKVEKSIRIYLEKSIRIYWIQSHCTFNNFLILHAMDKQQERKRET